MWRVYEGAQAPVPSAEASEQEIDYEKLLELDLTPLKDKPSRLKWHPFDPNKFMLVVGKRVVLVNSTMLYTQKHASEDHAFCTVKGPSPGEDEEER